MRHACKRIRHACTCGHMRATCVEARMWHACVHTCCPRAACVLHACHMRDTHADACNNPYHTDPADTIRSGGLAIVADPADTIRPNTSLAIVSDPARTQINTSMILDSWMCCWQTIYWTIEPSKSVQSWCRIWLMLLHIVSLISHLGWPNEQTGRLTYWLVVT